MIEVFNKAEYDKNYKLTEKGKLVHQKGNKKYSQTEKGRLTAKRCYQKNREKILSHNAEYCQTEKGKIAVSKKNARRKHNLGFIQIFKNPFDKLEIIEWHHITDVYVVAIPRDLHQLYYGKFHREKTMEIVKQVYLEMH